MNAFVFNCYSISFKTIFTGSTRLSANIFVSNWTPLDTASFPHFRFLDITLYPAYWPTFQRKIDLTHQGKTIKRHK